MQEADHGSYLEIYGDGQAGRRAASADGIAPRLVGKAKRPPRRPTDVPAAATPQYNVWRRYDRVAGDGKEQYLELYDRLDGLPDRQEARQPRQDPHGPRHHRAQGHEERQDAHRTTRARPCSTTRSSTRASGWPARPAAARFCTSRRTTTRRPTTRPRPRSPSSSTRASCGSSASRTRTATSTRSRPATACGARTWPTTTATACAARPATASTRTATSPRTGASTTRAPRTTRRRRPTAAPAPDSEPETKAMKGLWDRVDFVFQKNDHTAAELLLYPHGFQQYTPTPDDGIFEALAGDDADSAIADKVFNEETEEWDDHAATASTRTSAPSSTSPTATRSTTPTARTASSAYTPEGSEPNDPERLRLRVRGRRGRTVEAEFQRHRLFSLDLARVGRRPGEPVVAHGQHRPRTSTSTTVRGLLRRPAAGRGDGQASLGDVKLRYRINGGRGADGQHDGVPGRRAVRQRAGRLLPPPARHRRPGTKPGDEVEVWFEGGRQGAPRTSPTRRGRETGNKVLILVGRELHRPASRLQDPTGPHYLTYYTDALDANGVDVRHLRRRRAAATTRPGPRSACSATTTRWSGTRATTT